MASFTAWKVFRILADRRQNGWFSIVRSSIVRSLVVGFAMSCAACGAVDARGHGEEHGVRGFWVAPDWLLPSGGELDAASVQSRVRHVMDRVREKGGTDLFMEVFLRGYHVGTAIDGAPVYPKLLGPDGSPRFDLLQIVLDEAEPRGLQVHGWFHVFYWRTDNIELVKPGHAGPSVFDRLLDQYLAGVQPGLKSSSVSDLVRDVRDVLSSGFLDDRLRDRVRAHGFDPKEGTLQSILDVVRQEGVDAPDFLLTNGAGQLHPPIAEDRWKAIYLSPASEAVSEIVVDQARKILETYPKLAGLHLDHVRYPASPRGLRRGEGQLVEGASIKGPEKAALREVWLQERRERESAVTAVVDRIRQVVPRDKAFSAAVHPMYYYHRDDWTEKLEAPNFIAQDWYSWEMDFVAPMAYKADGARVGRILKRLRFGLLERWNDSPEHRAGPPPRIVPGTDRMELVGKSSPFDEWASFDFHQFEWVDQPDSPAGKSPERDSPKENRRERNTPRKERKTAPPCHEAFR